MDIFETVKAIVVEQLGRKPEDVKMDTTFKDLDIDSLDMVELIMAVEEEFEISINDDEAENISNMTEVVEFVKNKTGS